MRGPSWLSRSGNQAAHAEGFPAIHVRWLKSAYDLENVMLAEASCFSSLATSSAGECKECGQARGLSTVLCGERGGDGNDITAGRDAREPYHITAGRDARAEPP